MIIKTNILNPTQNKNVEFKENVFLEISDSRISKVFSETPQTPFIDRTNAICIPGLIDPHVHLSQFFGRGKHSSNLLEWLNNYIFPEEARAVDSNYAKMTSVNFFQNLLENGTTTSVIYTAPDKKACEIAFLTAAELGCRAIIGKTMMDVNSPKILQENTENSLNESFQLYHEWNKRTPLLEYVFSPRFAPVCSSKLMKKVADFAHENEAYIQTHLSENPDEIKWVRSLFPKIDSYTQVYEEFGLLTPKTLLGHVIHVSDEELEIIQKNDSKVIHCPDSNFFLKSGRFPIEKILHHKIDLALASDVGAGTDLSMFNVMKMANYRQEKYILTPAEAFYYATLGAAKVLGKEHLIGSIEKGKEADLVFIRNAEIQIDKEFDYLSKLIYLNDKRNIFEVYIAGKRVYEK